MATFDQANTAVSHGAKHITHLYNAATGFQHREPGVFGAAWLNQGLHTEMIVMVFIHILHPSHLHIDLRGIKAVI